MDNFHDETQEELLAELQRAVLALFSHTSTHAVSIQIPGTDPPLFVVAGEIEQLRELCEPAVAAGEAANDPVH